MPPRSPPQDSGNGDAETVPYHLFEHEKHFTTVKTEYVTTDLQTKIAVETSMWTAPWNEVKRSTHESRLPSRLLPGSTRLDMQTTQRHEYNSVIALLQPHVQESAAARSIYIVDHESGLTGNWLNPWEIIHTTFFPFPETWGTCTFRYESTVCTQVHVVKLYYLETSNDENKDLNNDLLTGVIERRRTEYWYSVHRPGWPHHVIMTWIRDYLISFTALLMT